MRQLEQIYELQFEEIRLLIEFRKSRAYQAVNAESIVNMWEVGRYVSIKLKTAQWGSKVVDMLVTFLKSANPSLKGYDRRSIYRMVQFYDTYSQSEFVGFIPPQIQSIKNQSNEIVEFEKPQLQDENKILSFLSLINWTTHIKIMSGCKDLPEMAFYIYLCHKERLKASEVERQIDASIYERSLLGNNNQTLALKETYPNVAQFFKDSYLVDYLNLPDNHNEVSLQKGLTAQMKKFILDLGKDFIFIDEEYRIQVGMSDFYIDLLFFHRGLQCLVAIELKTTKFKPEYIGQLDFYLEALDRDIKRENENPSIGILLCKNADNEVVEYALSRSLSPTMIAEYKRQLIPKEVLKKQLQNIYEKN